MNRHRIMTAVIVVIAIVGGTLAVTAWYVCRRQLVVPVVESDPSPNERAAIEKVVRESQVYEVSLYVRPDRFKEDNLTRYWVPDAPDILDRTDWHIIKEGVAHLQADGQHYGEEIKDATGKIVSRGSEFEEFSITQVKLTSGGNAAYVRTEEKWFCPLHDRSHNSIGQEHKGPYNLYYSLIKLNGTWFVVKSSTPRRQPGLCNWSRIAGNGLAALFVASVIIYFTLVLRMGKKEQALRNE